MKACNAVLALPAGGLMAAGSTLPADMEHALEPDIARCNDAPGSSDDGIILRPAINVPSESG